MPIIKQGNSIGKFYSEILYNYQYNYKKSNSTLMKSLAQSYGQVNSESASLFY